MTDSISPRTSKRAAYAILALLFLALAWNYRAVLLPGGRDRPEGELPPRSLARPALLLVLPLAEFPRDADEAASQIASWRKAGAQGVALTVCAWRTSPAAPRLEWFEGETAELREALLLLRENGMEPVVWAGISRARGDAGAPAPVAPTDEWLAALARAARDGGASAMILPRDVLASGSGDDPAISAARVASLHRIYSGPLGLNISDTADAARTADLPHIEFLAVAPDADMDGRADSLRCAALSLAAHRPVLLAAGTVRFVLHSALTMFTGARESMLAAPAPGALDRARNAAGAPWLRGVVVDARTCADPALLPHAQLLFARVAGAGAAIDRPARGTELREAP